VSGDGLRVVGESYSTSGNQAFLWTAASGMVGLGDLPGGAFFSRAKDISFDGAVVVGISASASGNEAFRWTEATGMVALGDLPGAGVFSQSNTVSGDGSVVGGLGTTGHPGSPFGFEAFVWTAPTGMRNLQALLEDDYGLDLGDWVLEMVVEMSDDARFLAGFGVNPGGTREAFRVELPDSDGDGVIDLVDVCPAVADPGQGDADADGIGDACDLPCDDGVDNDGDGATDFGADLGCRYADWPTESPACQDGVNNDPGMDDEIDWDGGASAGLPPEQQTAPDSHCDAPWRRAEGARNACGLGPEALVSIAVLCAARRRRRGSGDDFEGPLV
jgi:probable HAF family extracellular repeat protein